MPVPPAIMDQCVALRSSSPSRNLRTQWSKVQSASYICSQLATGCKALFLDECCQQLDGSIMGPRLAVS